MPDQYDQWARNWATGMRAAQSKVAPRREAARTVAVANRARGALKPCGIDGCSRHSYKGNICRKHYALVPDLDKMELTIACWDASRKTADRFHKRFLSELRERLAA